MVVGVAGWLLSACGLHLAARTLPALHLHSSLLTASPSARRAPVPTSIEVATDFAESAPKVDAGFRFVPHPSQRAPFINEIAELEHLVRRLPNFYQNTSADAPRQFKAELLEAAAKVAARAGGVERVGVGFSDAQLQRCYVIYSYLVHFYVWCEDGATEQTVPQDVAMPYWRVAKALGFEPVYTDAVIMWNMMGTEGVANTDLCDP